MFALDLKLEDAIAELEEPKDVFQWEVKPDDEVHEIKDLSRRQFEAMRAGKKINLEIRAFHERIFSNPFFKWLFGKIEASQSNQVAYFEPIQNALEAVSEGGTFFVTGLESEKGILVVISQKDESNFDPAAYVEKKNGWFYRNDPESPIQRGRGFQAISENRNIYLSFERLDGDFLTVICRPFDIKEQEKVKYSKIRHADKKITAAYVALVKSIGFEFDREEGFSDEFPDCSEATIDAVLKKVELERPDLLPRARQIIKALGIMLESRTSIYRNPDHILKEYEINS